MSFMFAGAGAPDYFPCRYGTARVDFRGPRRDLSRSYVAMLGGSQTFGRYVAAPFPTIVEEALGLPVANLGALNAGPEFYLADPGTLAVAAAAQAVVVQIAGAETVSNCFYTVHARRNDRFLAATPALRALYPELDFTEIHFTRHLLQELHAAGGDRFGHVVAGLKSAWLARMQALLAGLPDSCLLLWLADAAPPEQALALDGAGPLFVDRPLLETLRVRRENRVQIAPSPAARAEGVRGMQFPAGEHPVARLMLGAAAHREIAGTLVPHLADLLDA